MIIGADYEKITWKWGEWILMEPNTLLTDCLMSIICFYLAFKLWKDRERNPFVNWFIAFFSKKKYQEILNEKNEQYKKLYINLNGDRPV